MDITMTELPGRYEKAEHWNKSGNGISLMVGGA